MRPQETQWQRDAIGRVLWKRAAGRAILYLRRRHQMPQTDLARVLGITQSRLAKYERGLSRLDDVVAIQLAHALGVSPVRLFEVKYRIYRILSRREDARRLAGIPGQPDMPRRKRHTLSGIDKTR